MFQKLQHPYFLETSISKRWRTCILFSAFVFLFLLIFQPFGLGQVKNILEVSLGYGLTTLLVMSLLNIVAPPLLKGFFSEERWTVGKELLWNLLNLACIGLCNAVFNSFMEPQALSPATVLFIEAYTLSVGILPIAISVLLKEARLKKKYETRSEEINENLLTELPASAPGKISSVTSTIVIPSEKANESLQLLTDDLLYVQSSDNYVEVFYLQKQGLSKKLLRSSLKAVSESLETNPALFRCHKSFLVNLRKVKHVSGNAQGYKLQLDGCQTLIPVSRQYNNEIKNRLAAAP